MSANYQHDGYEPYKRSDLIWNFPKEPNTYLREEIKVRRKPWKTLNNKPKGVMEFELSTSSLPISTAETLIHIYTHI